MGSGSVIAAFIDTVRTDPHISMSHIGFFSAIIRLCNLQGSETHCFAKREQLMELARISSPTTYFRMLNELSEYGYISYHPSRNPGKCSRIVVHLENINEGSTKK